MLGMQHFEMAFVAIVVVLFALTVEKFLKIKNSFSIKFPISLLVGVILGKFFWVSYSITII